MTHVQHRISMLLLAGALAVATIAAIPATAAVAADTPGTGTCTTTITGPLTGALTAAVGTTCLTNVTLHGAITVNPGAALSIKDSTIYGAITTNGASAFTFCNSSTVGGAISVATSTGFNKSFERSNTMFCVEEPSTFLTPISLIRFVAVKDARPNKPRHAMNMASPEKMVSILCCRRSFL